MMALAKSFVGETPAWSLRIAKIFDGKKLFSRFKTDP